jgi:hypothetical protein
MVSFSGRTPCRDPLGNDKYYIISLSYPYVRADAKVKGIFSQKTGTHPESGFTLDTISGYHYIVATATPHLFMYP